MNSTSVWLATAEDFKSLLEMPPYSKSKIDCLSCRENMLVAENNGVVCGAISVSYKDILYLPGEWSDEFEQHLNSLADKASGGWLSKLYVFQKYRHQGIATKLIKESVDRLKEKKFGEVYAGIYVNNEFREVSEHIFKKIGFERIGSCICFFKIGTCRGILLKKQLDLVNRKRKSEGLF